jgi:YHYH protein
MAQTSAVRKLVACSAAAVTLAACGARASSGDAAPPSTSVVPGLPNSWSAVIDPKAIPLGDDAVSTKPSRGEIYSCRTEFGGGGPSHGGPWINTAAGTWDATSKVVVRGGNTWPQAVYQERVEGATRVVTTNDLPTQQVTGDFPVAVDDPAHQYDPNPNGISAHEVELRLPAEPKAAAQPGCVPMGAVGILKNGVFLYNGLDATGDDAAAHEAQDVCDGHPDQSHSYHYHNVPSCLLDAVPDEQGAYLVGYALDGYGIYVEHDERGNPPTNGDLDECHGRTSTVEVDGKPRAVYHYSASVEFPYTTGCFHGTPVAAPDQH